MGPVIDTFPHAVGGFTVERGAFYGDIYRSPFVDGYLEDFAETLIEAENLGADEVPDLLAVSFSALDTVGHGYGPNAPETLDVILRLDRTIGELLDFVDERIGLENVVVALSSDHGVGEVPDLVVRDGGDGGRFGTDQTLCLQRLQSRLKGRFGGGEFLLDTFYLDGETIDGRRGQPGRDRGRDHRGDERLPADRRGRPAGGTRPGESPPRAVPEQLLPRAQRRPDPRAGTERTARTGVGHRRQPRLAIRLRHPRTADHPPPGRRRPDVVEPGRTRSTWRPAWPRSWLSTSTSIAGFEGFDGTDRLADL